MSKPTIKQPLILFDGICNLCSTSVQFVIKQDHQELFYFAALQSQIGMEITARSTAQTTEQTHSHQLDSVLLYHNGKVYKKSSAALQTLKLLGGIWSLAYLFILVPLPIRNFIYDFIGRRRYRWFGKKKQCWLPDASLNKRFLDQGE